MDQQQVVDELLEVRRNVARRPADPAGPRGHEHRWHIGALAVRVDGNEAGRENARRLEQLEDARLVLREVGLALEPIGPHVAAEDEPAARAGRVIDGHRVNRARRAPRTRPDRDDARARADRLAHPLPGRGGRRSPQQRRLRPADPETMDPHDPRRYRPLSHSPLTSACFRAHVFQLAYTFQELRRRLGRTILTALGLALGVGLVIGIIGVSQGLDDAQGDVLAPLRSVGTDILVTRVTGATTDATGSTTTTTAPTGQAGGGFGGGPGGGGGFFAGRGNGDAQQNRQDTQELLSENRSVITDLSKLGKPGDKFTHDFFLSATLQSFPRERGEQDQEGRRRGDRSRRARAARGAPDRNGSPDRRVDPDRRADVHADRPPRPDDRRGARRVPHVPRVEGRDDRTAGGWRTSGRWWPGRRWRGGGFRGNPAFDDCLPAALQGIPGPVHHAPADDPAGREPAVHGHHQPVVHRGWRSIPSQPDVGLVTQDQLTSGRWLAKAAPNEVLVNVAYANTKSLKVGATIPINGTDYKIVGLVRPTLTGSTADIYFPLATLQKLATKENRVTQVLVKAKDADSVDAVAASIKKQLPGAEVVTTKGLADQVTGSLADAHELSGRLGTALAIIVLGAAFVIAALLTLASISKRVREIGTLRAIGWSKGRVVSQLLTETIGIGLLGGILGIGVGIIVVAAINALSPSLSATTAGVPGLNGSNLAGVFGQTTTVVRTTSVSLNAALHPSTLLLGVLFALVGGVLAGLIGGWRAARLSPVVALRDLG